jgi:hypothetical protein
MMMHSAKSLTALKRILFTLLLPAVLLPACTKKKKEVLGYLPANSSAVVTINAKQLLDKVAADGLPIPGLLSMNTGQLDTTRSASGNKAMLDMTGINFDQPVNIALKIPSLVNEPFVKVIAVIPLKDAEKFAKAIESQGFEKIGDQKGITYMSNEEATLGYDKNIAIYASALPATPFTGVITDNKDAVFSTDSARALIALSFNLGNSESMASVKNYNEMPIGTNDLRVWMNYESGLSSMLRGDLNTAALILEPLLKGSSLAATLNFEKGRLVGQSRMYFTDDAAAMLKSSASKSVDLSLLNTFPGSRLNGLLALSMDMKMLKDIVKYVNWDGNANAALGYIGLQFSDVLEAVSGDVVMAFADTKLTGDGNAAGLPANGNWAALVKIKDKAQLEKILNNPQVAEQLNLVKEGDHYVLAKERIKTYINVQGPVMVVSPNPQLAAQYNAGTAKPAFDAATLNRFKDKALGLYINTRSLTDSLPAPVMAKEGLIMSLMEEFFIGGAHFKDNYMQMDAEITVADKSRNYLSSIFMNVMTMMTVEPTTIRMPKDDVTDEADDRLMPMEAKPVAPEANK